MKKWLLVLGMITCMMGLTACSEKQANVENPMLTEADALGLGENVVETINLYVQQNAKDQITDAVLLSAVESWESAAEDMGDYIGIISTDSDITEDDGIIRVTVEGSTRNAVVELVLDAKKGITGISTNVEYTFKEKMGKAALNTLLGMGTVFVVLILISAIISCFNLIPGIQEKLSRKSKKAEVKESAPASSAPQAAVPVEEDLTDDLELVAVIAAAIAASEGAASRGHKQFPQSGKQAMRIVKQKNHRRILRMKNYTITVNGNVYDVVVEEGTSTGAAPAPAPAAPKAAPKAAPAAAPKAAAGAGSVKVEAGAAGKVFKVEASVGQTVKKGDTVVILEAMKMEIPVVAPQDGTVASIDVAAGDSVEAGALLATLK